MCQEELPTPASHQSGGSQIPDGKAHRLARSPDEPSHFFLRERQPDDEATISRVSKLVAQAEEQPRKPCTRVVEDEVLGPALKLQRRSPTRFATSYSTGLLARFAAASSRFRPTI